MSQKCNIIYIDFQFFFIIPFKLLIKFIFFYVKFS